MTTNTTSEAAELITATVTRAVARHADITAKFAADVAKSGMASAIEWAESHLIDLEVARRWAVVGRVAEQVGMVKALSAVIEQTTAELLGNQISSSSTSQLTNASAAAQREGASRWLRNATDMAASLPE